MYIHMKRYIHNQHLISYNHHVELWCNLFLTCLAHLGQFISICYQSCLFQILVYGSPYEHCLFQILKLETPYGPCTFQGLALESPYKSCPFQSLALESPYKPCPFQRLDLRSPYRPCLFHRLTFQRIIISYHQFIIMYIGT